MPPRRLFQAARVDMCLDCLSLQNEVEDLKEEVQQMRQRLTLLTLQLTMMRHELFGESVTRLDLNGDVPALR